MSAWGWPSGLVHNFKILLYKDNTQAQEWPSSFGDRYCLSVKSRKVLVAWVSVGRFKSKKRHSTFFLQRNGKNYYGRAMYKDHISTVPQWNAAFSVQETYRLNPRVTTRATSRKICPQGAQPTRMQANQATWATACPLHSQERQGPRRSREATKPPNQDFPWEGHHAQLSGVAQE